TVVAHSPRERDEHDADQEVARDLLGPRSRAVERVTREELVEDVGGEHPEEDERDPGLEWIHREVDRRVVRVEVPGLVDQLLVGHYVNSRLSFRFHGGHSWFALRHLLENDDPRRR